MINENEGNDLTPSDASHNRKHLGVQWNDVDDLLSFDFTEIVKESDEKSPTKRLVLRVLAKFYDPLGFIQPIIISLKVFFQKLCKEKVTWDELLSGILLTEWNIIRTHLHTLSDLSFQRCYLLNEVNDPFIAYELHGFSDASLQAYGACLYIRGIRSSGEIKCTLITSKSRVAPIKPVTIPLLELLGNLILSRLYVTLFSVLNEFYKFERTLLWTDSQITLAWIRSVSKEYKVFVENRVQEIRKLTDIESWRYCDTNSNPADLITRTWSSPSNLKNESLWWKGPSFLHTPDDQWPTYSKNTGNNVDDHTEIKNVTLAVPTISETHSIENLIEIKNYNRLEKLFRVTAWTLRFKNNLNLKIAKKELNLSSVISIDEIRAAEIHWIRSNQSHIPNENVKNWEQNLNLFRDEDGIIRCKGRLEHAPLPYESRNPILLTTKHRLALLIVAQCHDRVGHLRTKATLTELRERYWICRGRSFVRMVLIKCRPCRRALTKSYDAPVTPPLPSLRLKNNRAFSSVGIDNFGPLHVKDIFDKSNNAYSLGCFVHLCRKSWNRS